MSSRIAFFCLHISSRVKRFQEEETIDDGTLGEAIQFLCGGGLAAVDGSETTLTFRRFFEEREREGKSLAVVQEEVASTVGILCAIRERQRVSVENVIQVYTLFGALTDCAIRYATPPRLDLRV